MKRKNNIIYKIVIVFLFLYLPITIYSELNYMDYFDNQVYSEKFHSNGKSLYSKVGGGCGVKLHIDPLLSTGNLLNIVGLSRDDVLTFFV